MFAREGADVSIIYLPNQEKDAEDVKKSVEEAGRRCLLLPGNLRVRKFCEESVEKHVTAFGGLNVGVSLLCWMLVSPRSDGGFVF